MYEIIKKEWLSDKIVLMDVKAKWVARACLPGQFIIVRMDEKGERIPLTICDYNREQETITLVFQIIGASTMRMAQYEVGDAFFDVTGPLGKYSEWIDEPLEELAKKKILFVAGGVGTAPVYPQVKWLCEKGIKADCIIGARNKSLIILEDEMSKVADNLYIATDDGSYGFHGNVNDRIKALVAEGKQYDLVIAIGPMIMMKFVTLTAKKFNLPCIVSLNALMVDGTGMCGACRVTIAGKTKFTCVDGPEFNAYDVDFDEAMRRQGMYRTQEQRAQAIQREREAGHKCNIGLDK